jgi:molybdate transport system substrate-binding protein
MRHISFFLIIAGLFISGMATSIHAAQIRIAAAASLTEAVKAVIVEYERLHPDTQIIPNFASSGSLARQLSSGAPAHIYISANPKWMQHLKEQGIIVPESIVTLVKNRLVVVGLPSDTGITMDDLTSMQRIALGSPASVPAGRYAQQAMSNAGIYTLLEGDKRLIFAKDVRQALLYADRGEVNAAFVYATDALLARNAVVIMKVDADLHPPITYPAGITQSGKDHGAALDFFRFLGQETAVTLFKKYGFSVPEEA